MAGAKQSFGDNGITRLEPRNERVWRGMNCALERTVFGWRASGKAAGRWRHPWEVDCAFVATGEGVARGEWRATVNPGFVNGRPACIEMTASWLREQVTMGAAEEKDFGINPLSGERYFSAWVFKGKAATTKDREGEGPGGPVRLTNSPAPYLVLGGWRNPAVSLVATASLEGEVVFAKAEGYPKFFESLGVRPAARGGKTGEAAYDSQRTREIRAMDILLTQPRTGSALTVTELNPVTDNFTHQLETTFTSAYYTAQEGRAKLTATAKYRPILKENIDSPFLGLPMNAEDPQVDQLLVATVWMVSPPGVGNDAVPDRTWEPYVQHFVFWNLWHASRFTPPAIKMPPLKITTGLGLGILDFLGNAFLAPINSAMDEAQAFLQQSDMSGQFWST